VDQEGVIRRQLAALEALLRLGFIEESVSARWNDGRVQTTLQVDGKEFVIGQISAEQDPLSSEQEYNTAYKEARETWKDVSPGTKRHVYKASFDVDKLGDLAVAIRRKGIKIPALPDREND
jgi:hypothetical protein